MQKNYHIAIVSPQVVGIGQTPQTYSSQQINLAHCWADAGHFVDIITGKCNGLAEAFSHERIRLFENPVFRLGGRFGMPVMLGGWSQLNGKSYDMVFSSEHYQPATFLSCLFSKNVFIYQGQNIAGTTVFKKLAIKFMEALFNPVMKRRYRKIIAKTDAAERFIRQRGFDRAVTIPCGYDADRFRLPSDIEREDSRAYFGFDDKQKIMVYAGNLLARRNVATAIEACAMIRGNGTDVHLIIAGKGPELERLRSLADEKGVAHVVHFKGHLDWIELRKVYWAGDVFVFPTRYEIFGMVLMEALACGLKIVSTPCPAANDIIKECPYAGKLAPIGDYEVFASHCMQLFFYPPKKNLDLEIDRFVDKNSWRGIADRILKEI